MPKPKFYAVAQGRSMGVFSTWDECKGSVTGFSGARFKSFGTQAEAQAFIATHSGGGGSSGGSGSGSGYSESNLTVSYGGGGGYGGGGSSSSSSYGGGRYSGGSYDYTRGGDVASSSYSGGGGRSSGFSGTFSPGVPSRRLPGPSAKSRVASPPASAGKRSRGSSARQFSSAVDDHAAADETAYAAAPKRARGAATALPVPLPEPDMHPAAHAAAPSSTHVLYTDGASRGNPGRAGAGALLQAPDGSVRGEWCCVVGERETNNAAEYHAVELGLEQALRAGVRDVEVRMDSELVHKQLTGAYRVRHPELRERHARVMSLLGRFDAWRTAHVPREQNARADALANAALDGERS